MKIKVLAVLFMVFLVGCIGYQSRVNIIEGKQLESALSRIVCVAEVKAENSDVWREIKSVGGTSFPIGNGLQIGLTHATDLPEKFLVMTPFGLYWGTREVRNKRYFIDEVEIELLAEKGDVSIFKKPSTSSIKFVLGEDPVVGTELFVIGDSMLLGNNWKTGIVSMAKAPPNTGIDLSHCFVHTVPSNGGDSGSPILARKPNCNYEVVGILNASLRGAQAYNTGIYVSFVKELLDSI